MTVTTKILKKLLSDPHHAAILSQCSKIIMLTTNMFNITLCCALKFNLHFLKITFNLYSVVLLLLVINIAYASQLTVLLEYVNLCVYGSEIQYGTIILPTIC